MPRCPSISVTSVKNSSRIASHRTSVDFPSPCFVPIITTTSSYLQPGLNARWTPPAKISLEHSCTYGVSAQPIHFVRKPSMRGVPSHFKAFSMSVTGL
ncbi:MAG: hypothetical protein BWY06_03443 [Candidatus Latescibacteria bacterium ADurb.Bin168]|nr:MAG: hypothetical protein BWY06_03443 [Candidatus Latescibacteria bacterium ADurb.Bin168]